MKEWPALLQDGDVPDGSLCRQSGRLPSSRTPPVSGLGRTPLLITMSLVRPVTDPAFRPPSALAAASSGAPRHIPGRACAASKMTRSLHNSSSR